MSNSQAKQHLDESLSALVDGEASDLELRQILKALDDDNSYSHLRDNWKTAHQTGAAMRSDDLRFANLDISSKVSEAISNVSTESVAETKATSWKEIWGKTGVAAAVALGVLFTFQITNDDTAPASQVAQTAPTEQLQPAAPQWFKQAPINARAASVSGEGSSNVSRSVFDQHHSVDLNSEEQLQLHLQQILKEHTQEKK